MIVLRTASGLPRGWTPAILAGSLYLIAARRHALLVALLLPAALLNPPATLGAAACYAAFLLVQAARPAARPEHLRRLVRFGLAAPLIALVTYQALRPPSWVGRMVSLSEARSLEHFQAGGRFPFLPFDPPLREIQRYAAQAFLGVGTAPAIQAAPVFWLAVALLAALLAAQARTRRELLPVELLALLGTALGLYFAARILAFHLFVPGRYLRDALILFAVTAFPVALWRLLLPATAAPNDDGPRVAWRPAAALCALAAVVAGLSGGHAPISGDVPRVPGPHSVTAWARRATPPHSMFGGHPKRLDGMPLFGARPAYVTAETDHPFYEGYRNEMGRRLEITFRAHYADSAASFLEAIDQEKIDYFVFDLADFRPETLAQPGYYRPWDRLIRRLASRPADLYFATNLGPYAGTPVIPFRNRSEIVIDIAALHEKLGDRL
jgi:hypothetical protein